MPVLVKAILICMTVTSIGGRAPTTDTTQCIPMTPNQTNAINEETSVEYEVVHTVFFLPSDLTEEGLNHGDLILDASMNPIPSE